MSYRQLNADGEWREWTGGGRDGREGWAGGRPAGRPCRRGQTDGQYSITFLFIDYVRIVTRHMLAADDNQQNGSAINGNLRKTTDFSGFMYYVNDGVFGSFNLKIYGDKLLEVVPVPAQVG